MSCRISCDCVPIGRTGNPTGCRPGSSRPGCSVRKADQFSSAGAIVDLPAGIVLWGAVECMTVIAVFLRGRSANALFPLLGSYRYVAIRLPVRLISMFVLIAAALPAQSPALGAIVQSQAGIWNVVRETLGLPLFVLLGLSLTLRGPFNYADSADLAGGTDSERSGPPRALWQCARLSMDVHQ
ncbi:MAG: NADH-quinone oxidoreductase subunit H [Burkholderiaceae bacterium]